jgi:hypothetical protein
VAAPPRPCRTMKSKLLPFFFFLAGLVVIQAEDAPKKLELSLEFRDPRQTPDFHVWIEDGKLRPPGRSISASILIICWSPAPNRSPESRSPFEQYQISGLDGYHTKEQIERFLTAFYDLDHQNSEIGSKVPNVILAGNNWGAGLELQPKLQKLSKAESFAVFYAGGWAFSKALLIAEPEARLKLIQAAYKKANP